MTCKVHERCRRCLLNTGNRPKTSIEKRVSEKTWVGLGKRDANTVDAMSAALVESEAGNFVPTPPP